MQQNLVYDFIPLLLLVTTAPFVKGQDCLAGSSYENIISGHESMIDTGYWYLNLNEPCTCSGEVIKYEVFYYNLIHGTEFNVVHTAVWRPRETEDGIYDLIESSKKRLRKSPGKRKKRASISGSDADSVSGIYIRKGSIIGVYFQMGDTPWPIIGSESERRSVCKYKDTSYSTTVVDCTLNSSMEHSTLIHATAHINKIECDRSKINNIQSGNYDLIDGDAQYGARVRYYCNEGYQVVYNGGDGMVMCDKDKYWVGTLPSCVYSCEDISISNGIIIEDPSADLFSITFTCNPGYELHGSSSTTCLTSGTWSDTIPTCDIIECSSNVSSPFNGYINMTSITYGSNIIFGCDNGYELKGNTISTCQADKNWSSAPPICVPKEYSTINLSITSHDTITSVTISPLSQTIHGVTTSVIRTSTTTLLPSRSSEVRDNSFPIVPVAAALGIAVFIIIVLIITMIVLILLVVRYRKRGNRTQGTQQDNHINSLNVANCSISERLTPNPFYATSEQDDPSKSFKHDQQTVENSNSLSITPSGIPSIPPVYASIYNDDSDDDCDSAVYVYESMDGVDRNQAQTVDHDPSDHHADATCEHIYEQI